MDPWHDINLSNRRYSEEELQEIQERYLVKPAEAKGDSCTGEGWLSLEVGAGGPDQSDRPKEVAPQGDRERVSCGNRGSLDERLAMRNVESRPGGNLRKSE